MEIERKIARLIYPGFWFDKTDPADAEKLVDLGVGGFCIYGGTAAQVKEFTDKMRARAAQPLIIAADYEDGIGRWVKEGTLLPSNMAIGASGSTVLAAKKAAITAVESRALGVDWVFAPVLDLATNSENPIVNTRAFGDDPEKVASLAAAFIAELRRSGALNSAKHFPGHGETSVDSHLQLPELTTPLSTLEQREMKPYKLLIDLLDSVMIGHLRITEVDSEFPASFSRKFISGILKHDLAYNGCIVTDALSMKAIKDENKAALTALLAGVDILLVPENPFGVYQFLKQVYEAGALPDAVITAALKKQADMLAKISPFMLDRPEFSKVGCKEHHDFVAAAAPKCVAWSIPPKQQISFAGKKVFYVEPSAQDAASWEGQPFVEELRRCGAVIASKASDADIAVIGAFSRPRAFSGSINIPEAVAAKVLASLPSGKPAYMVSFGSPYVFKHFRQVLSGGLCLFSYAPEMQCCGAKVLCGLVTAEGTMPVKNY